jgi:hypothetical protein
MAKAKKKGIVIDEDASVPPAESTWPFESLKVGKGAFFVDAAQHQAVRTAASRAGVRLGRKFSARKVKDADSPQFGRIGIYRLK